MMKHILDKRQNILSTTNLDGTIKGGTGEGIGILGVECHLHDIVRMAFENLSAHKTLLPVPQLDQHIIR